MVRNAALFPVGWDGAFELDWQETRASEAAARTANLTIVEVAVIRLPVSKLQTM
ncbi:hypothetical protein ABID44_001550 [Aquamicrobium ahrensii]|uniref:Uncharacterized protein n=1 Tax=Aquamicrobium ahrensii TaxID=469551 RepID=A0ABV2KJH5_9HYPH